MIKGGNMPCIMNAANEIAVAAFLKEEVRFLEIGELIEQCMEEINFIQQPTLEDYRLTDTLSREWMTDNLRVKNS
jgi:1-deoxy-D-xylulose-5-phosphate reductoisomerase